MESPNKLETVREIENFVRSLNKTWVEKRTQDLNAFFHDDVIALPPGNAELISGREAMVESYRQFSNTAKVHNFEELKIQVNVFNNTAIANTTFHINYEVQGKVYSEKGTDILVLNNFDNEWMVVWRTQIPITSNYDFSNQPD
jgi:ketosteroid isomerase-like protein